jgi:hypothetical protein
VAPNRHLFVDDNLMLVKASEEGDMSTNKLSGKYWNASVQRDYLDKSYVLFSKGVHTHIDKMRSIF